MNNDNQQPDEICNGLLNAIISIHSNNFNKYGFEFDTQIGGLRQKIHGILIGLISIRKKGWDIFLIL